MSLWGELKRRNVFKVAATYIIVAWLIVQVANTFFPILHLPEWTVTLVAVLVILGFPLALLFAWAFELTPDGVKRSEHVPLEESITHMTGRKLNYVLVGVIVFAVGYILFDNLYLDRRVVETEVVSTVTERAAPATDVEEAPKTIAVLPFADLSPEKDQEYFVDGLSEEILNSLAKISDLRVIARTSSFSFKGTNKKIQEIADELGADHILEGSVRKAGDALRITAQLIHAADGIHLWSETYDRNLKDIFKVQEDIAMSVADELKVKLGMEESLRMLGGTDNEKAYEMYLIAKGYYNTPPVDNRSLESINKAIELDAGFALAWALKSGIQQALARQKALEQQMPQDVVVKGFIEGLDAAQKAIELEPNLPNGYISLGGIKSSIGEWTEAGLAYRKALGLITDPAKRFDVFGYRLLWFFGYLTKAKERIEAILLNDPLNAMDRTSYILCFGYLGEYQQAEKEYERAKSLFGEAQLGMFDWAIALARFGSGDTLKPGDIMDHEFSNTAHPLQHIIKEHIDSPEEGLAELRRIYTEVDHLSFLELSDLSVWAAYFGDPHLALDAQEKAYGITSEGFRYVWFPVNHEVRQLPRFKEFVREIGLVDFWNEFGWPDLCHPTDDGDFECD